MIDTETMIDIETQPEGTYWHFISDTGCLRYGDKSRVIPGETLRVNDTPILCERGFHASLRVLDALVFAPGPIVCLVTLGGEVIHEPRPTTPDKSVGQERTAIWGYDASDLLKRFACGVAYDVLLTERKAGREPDPRSFAVIETVRRFVDNEATRDEWAAAKIAAENAARDTKNYVAKNAAWSATWIAAFNPIWSATWIAANTAIWGAAWVEANNANNARLTSMLLAAMKQGKGDFAPSNADGLVLASAGLDWGELD